MGSSASKKEKAGRGKMKHSTTGLELNATSAAATARGTKKEREDAEGRVERAEQRMRGSLADVSEMADRHADAEQARKVAETREQTLQTKLTKAESTINAQKEVIRKLRTQVEAGITGKHAAAASDEVIAPFVHSDGGLHRPAAEQARLNVGVAGVCAICKGTVYANETASVDTGTGAVFHTSATECFEVMQANKPQPFPT
jgi:hypothetical protein